MLGQTLRYQITMSLNKRRILASNDQKFVRISEKFELTNLELSYRFCSDLIANAYRAKEFVRIGESSNYRLLELTGVDSPTIVQSFIVLKW